ncbi:putative+ABC+transporter+permease+protein [Methylocapsa aurea]|uniref:FecCD family ABC transporter permease n=1 Tax=Methylocapsa aurea TaxID=663610 RepID=UPI003D18B5C0
MTDVTLPAARAARDERGPRTSWTTPILLVVALFLAIIGSLCIGAYPLRFERAAEIVFHLALPIPLPDDPPWTIRELTVVQIIRLPRVLVATLAGLALGMSGAALQGMLRNPLVGPDLVGVSSGAAFGGVLAMLLDWPPAGVVALAFGGGLIAMACAFWLANLVKGGGDGALLLLAGIFIGAFFMSCVGLAQFLANDAQLPNMVFWLLGTFTRSDPERVLMLAIPTLLGGALLMLLRWRINLLSLGDLDAATLGVGVRKLRWTIIAVVSLIVASQVSVSGVIGWTGLVVPHCARMLVGPDHRRLLPASALLGALFTLAVDDFTRTILRTEVPTGVVTAMIGTPIVCFLFWKMKAKGWIND